jgi:hypothetical protein
MNLNELMKNAMEMAKEVGAERRLNKIELRKLMEEGSTERARIKSGEGPSFTEKRAVFTDAQKYIDDLRDKDTKEIYHPALKRALTEKEIKGMYDTKVKELEGKYIGRKAPVAGVAPKEEMVITGDVLVNGKKLPQRDLNRLFPGATYRKPLVPTEVAPSPAPGINLPDITPQYAAGPMMGSSPSQLNLADVTKPAPATAQLTLPKEESGIMGRSLKDTMGGEAARAPSEPRKSLRGLNLPGVTRSSGMSITGPLWDYLKKMIHEPTEEKTWANLSLADLLR